jgi:uncharacterized protein (DUF433 family)
MVIRAVRQRARVQPNGRLEIQTPELPAGAEVDVLVTYDEPPAAAPPEYGETPVEGMPEIDIWTHHGERRAKLRGTGLEVWEIVSAYLEMDRDFGKLVVGFNWLSFEQIRAALVYANANPEEIGRLIARKYERVPDEFKPKRSLHWP